MDVNHKTTVPFIERDLIIPERVQNKLLRKKPGIIYIVGGAGFGKTSLLKVLYAKSVKNEENIWYNIDTGDIDTDGFLNNLYSILKSRFNLKKKPKENYSDYIIRVLNERLSNGIIFFDNVHNLGPNSEIKLYYIIQNTPQVRYIISKRPSQVTNVKEILYNPKSLVLTEEDLNFTINDIKKILKIMKLPLKYAKLIHWQSRGYPFSSKLMIYSCKGNKNNKFLAGKKMELLFDGILSQFKDNEKELMILSSLIPDAAFPMLVNKIKDFPSIDKLRRKGVPIVVFRDTFQYHINFNNFLKRKSVEIDIDKRNGFFKDLLKKTRKKEIKYILLYMLRDYRTLENEISNLKFSKLYREIFSNVFLIDSGTLDKNEALEKIERFPHLYLFFSYMYAQEMNEIQFTPETKNKIISNLIDYLDNFNEDWKEMAYTMIVGFAFENQDIETVKKYGEFLTKAEHNRGIVAVGIGSYAQMLAATGDIERANKLWNIAKEWGKKYDGIFAVLNAILGNIEYLINVAEDYEGAFPLIMEGANYAKERNLLNAQYYLYKQSAEYYLFKKDYNKVKIYVNRAMEIADYFNIKDWKIFLYLILFKMYDNERDIKSMEEIVNNLSNNYSSEGSCGVGIINYLNARLYFRRGNYSTALRLADSALESQQYYPLNEDEIILTKIYALMEDGKLEKAKNEVINLIKKSESLGKTRSLIKYYGILYRIDGNKKSLKNISTLMMKNNFWSSDSFLKDNVDLLYALYNEKIDADIVKQKLKEINEFNRIELLGNARMILTGKIRVLTEKKPVELLVILLMNYKKMLNRDRIIEWLYPDYEGNGGLKKAKDNLRKTVSRLNKILGNKYIKAIISKDGGYILDFDGDYTVDLIEFTDYADNGIDNNNVEYLVRAYNLYSGKLLNNFQYVVDKVQEYREDINNKFIVICEKLKENRNINKFHINEIDIEKKLKNMEL
ncbi:hypothetical protein J7L48_03960 [bacterium]|nr:hypothetical protein [bacterium]